MPPTRVAIAGATGNLGIPLLKTLLDADHHVTVLSRTGSNASSKLQRHPNLTIKEVDFTSAKSITPVLDGVEVVISCLATSAIGSQNPLIDAAVLAGVKRFIPAEFGMDSLNPLCVQLPVCAPKATTQAYLNAKVKENPEFSWTAIANGWFLDWCLKEKLIADMEERQATLYNGGDVPFSVTLLADVAIGVLGVINHQAETANRVVYIQSTFVTQNKLIGIAKSIDGGKEWKTSVKSTEQVLEESYEALEKGDSGEALTAELGFCLVGCLSSEYGCDFSAHLDNDLLGLKEMSEEELEEVVASFLA
ncbi:oxidoreductase CipA-like protein [Lophiotrema nucula]|uniref:Oxidoreductase CipA-like protein n=1 Tax=Lophiotrema nucula TaxID=690887 RepID=A0A6A5ZWI4_9PLEO|nr:oxidoreductase CipA-like protein [Lophiotrema nucula]